MPATPIFFEMDAIYRIRHFESIISALEWMEPVVLRRLDLSND